VHYQPIVPLRAGRSCQFEALVRWSHPVRGPLSPAEFIPIAERSGLIKPMTALILRRSVAAASSWRAAHHEVAISVNVSMRNLQDPQFVGTVARHIAEHGLSAERLCLEITEGVAMADPEHTLAVLRQLRDMGVRIAIDDFGTGYSSLGYLRRLPVDALKIDRSFVGGLPHDAASLSIVKATIELGHSLGLTVVAEGVEHDAQLAALRELGCDWAQGYRIARPMPSGDVQGWLAREAGKYTA
jgi:EAL domain-containing protein (putative c-di-GMP-specific phosphodiesterase class I)